jgi:hypothetical protein
MPASGGKRKYFPESHFSKDKEGFEWLIQTMKEPQAVFWTEAMKL